MIVHEPFKHPGDGGFTFLEIMVSLVVLSLVLVTVFNLQSGTVKVADRGNFYNTAPLLARYQLSQLLSDSGTLSGGSGDFGDPFPGWAWSVTLTRPDPGLSDSPLSESQAKALVRIDIRITGPGQAAAYHLSTLRYLPDHETDIL